ncbi:hypothetical protein CR62_17375 [Serratia grimesii]|uniref:Uncharacterized protein n=1 Tax=Serratia grimesii TaxID=82995 RepID=A0ABR4U4B4_9GAMM|nr:hypothetical protein CR62_17375 [Serratia grimesii]
MVLANAKSNALMLGDFTAPGALIALCGLFLAIALQARRIPGAILWAILFATLVGIPFGVTHLPTSLMAMPHSLAPVFGHVDLIGALNIAFLPYLFVFFASEFFSTMGTTLAVGGKPDCWTSTVICRTSTAPSWWTLSPQPSVLVSVFLPPQR